MGKPDLSGNEWTLEQNRRYLADQRRRQQMSWVGGGGAAPFIPSDLAPYTWWDPSDLSTLFQDSALTTPVTTDSQPVGALLDKSGNGRHLLQAVPGSRPLYRTAGGLRWLEFTPTSTLDTGAFTALNQPFDGFTAFRPISAGGTDSAIWASSGVTLGYVFVDGLVFNAGNFNVILMPSTFFGQDIVTTEVLNGAASSIRVDAGAPVTGNPGSNGISRTQLNSGSNPGTFNFFGRILMSRPSTVGEREQVLTYLAGKQGRVL